MPPGKTPQQDLLTFEDYLDSHIWGLSSFMTSSVCLAVLCAMFHHKNNKMMYQRNQVPKLDSWGEFVIDDLCVSQAWWLTPLSLRSESVVTSLGRRTSLMTTRFIGMLYLWHLWWQACRERELGLFSQSIAQFIPRQGFQSASLHSKGEGSAAQSNESCINLLSKVELELDVHMKF